MDNQQKGLVGQAHLQMRLIEEGFEIAWPARDRGIDLIVYSDEPGKRFRAVPIQVKAATKKSFSVERKYEGRGIVYAFVWHIRETPRLFLVPYEKAIELLPESAKQSETFRNKGEWKINRPSDAFIAKLEEYEDKFDVLRTGISRGP